MKIKKKVEDQSSNNHADRQQLINVLLVQTSPWRNTAGVRKKKEVSPLTHKRKEKKGT
jgi:hypothetical protein